MYYKQYLVWFFIRKFLKYDMTLQLCLTIAGSDSGGEAGVQADLSTFKDFNCHGLSTITAVTAQNPKHILSLNQIDHKVIKEQLGATFSYFKVEYIKTGLLGDIQIMETILEEIPDNSILVCDPLISSTSGKTIMNDKEINFFQSHFSKRINYITPNLPEAKILTGENSFEATFDKLKNYCKNGFYFKGGHSKTPGTDHFYCENHSWKLEAPVLKIKSSHGTGCRISSGLCAGLALGYKAIDAARLTKNYVFHTLKSCKQTKQGHWLMSSPGNVETLSNEITITKLV